MPSVIDHEQLAAEYGTPLYVYDADIVRARAARLSAAFPGARLLYAAKALPTLAILRLIESEGLGLDTVSIEEVRLGLRAGFSPERILFTPSCVPFGELREAVELGVLCNVESLSHLERFGAAYGGDVPCCLRLDPRLRDGPGEIAVWYDESKFGVPLEHMDAVLDAVRRHGTRIVGLHLHANHVVQGGDLLLRATEVMLAAARRLPGVRSLDFGGGFNVAMRAEERPPAPEDVAAVLLPALERARAEIGRDLELWLEPGRFLVAECGLLLTRVTVVKEIDGTRVAGVDTGFHHLVRPKMYGAWHGVRNLTRPDAAPRRTTVVGHLCEGDTLARERELSEVREGDLLALENAGAYGASMASNYNARPRPAEVLVDGGQARLVRRRETLEDLLRTQL